MLPAAMLLLAVHVPLPVLAESGFRESADIGIEAHAGHFAEKCLELSAGRQVRYRVNAPHPTDFNVHFHGPDSTTYPVPPQRVREKTGRFTTHGDGSYCFMWTNRQRRSSPYDVELRYTVDDAPTRD